MKPRDWVRSLVLVAAFAAAPRVARADPGAAVRLAPTVASRDEADRLFRAVATRADIAFTYVKDGCYARAHLMVKQLTEEGVLAGKVWAFQNGDPLRAKTPHLPAGFVEWGYHVAPTVRVRTADRKTEVLVFDPSLFAKPVAVEEWTRAMKKTPASTPFVCQTRAGEAPLLPTGERAPGTGYWKKADPAGGLDEHAKGVMKTYLAAGAAPVAPAPAAERLHGNWKTTLTADGRQFVVGVSFDANGEWYLAALRKGGSAPAVTHSGRFTLARGELTMDGDGLTLKATVRWLDADSFEFTDAKGTTTWTRLRR